MTVQTLPSVKTITTPWHWSTKTAVIFALLATCSLPWIKLNLTSSAPRGVWLRHGIPAVIPHGTWVIIPTPAAVKAWAPQVGLWSIPLLKPVAAVAGESVCVDGGLLWIQGLPYGRVHTEAQGQPLPHLANGCTTIPDAMVFVASPVPQSLDSRYFDSVAVTDILATATPLLTWR
jgi:conjugative transfer signal peptidase TraF